MESLGEFLRRERERRGLTLDDIARVTRVRKPYLEALEGNHFDRLPAPPFVRGFLAAYAKQVGLAADDVLARYHAALAGAAGARPPAPAAAAHAPAAAAPAGALPAPARARHVPVRPPAPRDPTPEGTAPAQYHGVLILAGLVAVAALAVLGSMLAQPAAPPVRTTATPARPAANGVGEVAAAPAPEAPREEVAHAPAAPEPPSQPAPTPQAVAARPSPAPRPAPRATPLAAPAAIPVPVEPPAVAPPAPAAAVAVEAAATPAAVGAAPALAPAPARLSTLTASATEDTWLSIAIDGAAPVEALLRAGDRASWRGGSFEVVVGNAGGVSLEVDGVPQGPLGELGRRVSVRLPRSPSR